MAKLEKATDFYLRGHRSSYIKRRTGYSTQQLLKQKLSEGIHFTKDDIRRYQVNYIRKHFSNSDIEAAYRKIMNDWDDPYKAGHGNKIVSLGCGFGDYAKVFRTLLGENRYQVLRNECWKAKQAVIIQCQKQ